MNTINYNFPTVFGRNLLREFQNFVHSPYLIVTMKDLWPNLQTHIDPGDYHVYYVSSTEESDLIKDLHTLPKVQAFVGIGGGQAIDVAKYFSWQLQKPLFQLPTILSVDAMFGHRSGLRNNSKVFYKGWAVPECIFFDFDIIKSAPKELNYSGIGDVLCFHTGVLDWKLATKKNKNSAHWPYNESLAETSLEKVNNLILQAQEIKQLSDKGIECLVDAFKWGGLSYFTSGWCPCHIEGIDHFFFYTLEYLTGKKFVHGKPVCMGVYIGSLLHNNRAAEILQTISNIGLDIRPESMDLNWNDIWQALTKMKDYVKEQNLWYSIAHETEITQDFFNTLKDTISKQYTHFKK